MRLSGIPCKLFSIGSAVACAAGFSTSYADGAPARSAKAPVKQAHGGASNANSAALNSYVNRLRSKLETNWLLPDGKNNVTISATVHGDGTCDNIEVSSSPKNAAAEASSQDALSKAQPLETLPAGINEAKLTLTFVSSADPHGDSSSNILTRLDPIAAPKPTGGAGNAK